MESLDIRPYRQEDREAVYRIAADTAFFGESVEHFLDDRRLFRWSPRSLPRHRRPG